MDDEMKKALSAILPAYAPMPAVGKMTGSCSRRQKVFYEEEGLIIKRHSVRRAAAKQEDAPGQEGTIGKQA